tara:strand:- start:29057 stop:30475 length:1419 start_codon:yes stop_codon:yes gene_type:complete
MTIQLADHIKAYTAKGPRYRVIADAISVAIKDGILTSGEKLPPMRTLGWALGVTTGTIARAYALGVTRKELASEVGRGTFVSQRQAPTLAMPAPVATSIDKEDPADGIISLKANLPANIGQSHILAEETARLVSEGRSGLFDYLPAGGTKAHREAGAAWLGTGVFMPSPADIILCSGAQQAIMAAILAATDPGDVILTESLTYHAITSLALMLDRRVMPVEIDNDGLMPDALARACRGSRVTALFTVPTLHNPTTTSMSAGRRQAIAEMAAAQQLSIIEDDIYANLMAERPLPLKHLLPDKTYYINSLSKAVAPGLRLGYLVPPRATYERSRAIIHGLGQTLPPLMAELGTRIITNGVADTLTGKQRTEISERNRMANRLLGDAPRRQNAAAMHIWLQLPDSWRATSFVEAARHRGVLIAAGEEFMVGRPDQASRHVRLCLGAASDCTRMEQGLKTLSQLMEEAPIEMQTLA